MNNSNKKKVLQLGMSLGKANARLRKMILFNLVKKLNFDICYRCGEKIIDIKDLSIEHKIAWLDSENPVELFFDLNNISFSHLKCNVGNSRGALYKSKDHRLKISKTLSGRKLPEVQKENLKSYCIKNNTEKKFGEHSQKGIKNKHSIIRDINIINEIRDKYKKGIISKELSEEYKVSDSTICRIVNYKRY